MDTNAALVLLTSHVTPELRKRACSNMAGGEHRRAWELRDGLPKTRKACALAHGGGRAPMCAPASPA